MNKKFDLENKIFEESLAYEKQQTGYFFFKSKFIPNPETELELEEIQLEIARLEKDKDNYFKVIQNAGDYSQVPYFSKRLASFGLATPAEQLFGFIYGTFGLLYAIPNLLRANYYQKMMRSPDKLCKDHFYGGGDPTPEQTKSFTSLIRKERVKGTLGLLVPVLVVSYAVSKRKTDSMGGSD